MDRRDWISVHESKRRVERARKWRYGQWEIKVV